MFTILPMGLHNNVHRTYAYPTSRHKRRFCKLPLGSTCFHSYSDKILLVPKNSRNKHLHTQRSKSKNITNLMMVFNISPDHKPQILDTNYCLSHFMFIFQKAHTHNFPNNIFTLLHFMLLLKNLYIFHSF